MRSLRSKLVPCPRCGRKAEIDLSSYARTYIVTCEIHCVQSYGPSPQAAAAHWNARQELERLRG